MDIHWLLDVVEAPIHVTNNCHRLAPTSVGFVVGSVGPVTGFSGDAAFIDGRIQESRIQESTFGQKIVAIQSLASHENRLLIIRGIVGLWRR